MPMKLQIRSIRTPAGGSGSLFFYLTASTDERIPLLQYTGTLRNEGCPTRRVYAWGFVSYRHNRSRQRIKTANNQIKSPTRKPDVWATQFISSFGVRATRRGDYS